MKTIVPIDIEIEERKDSHLEKILIERAIKKQQMRQKRANTTKALETCLKIVVNLGISTLAYFSIWQLIPYYRHQQAKLAEIDAEIAKIKPRVERLGADFSTTFDPNLTRKNIEKNTYKVDPNLSPVFFVPKK